MPYRRLPNTDMARLRALKAALVMGEQLPPFKLAFSSANFQRLKNYLPQFENMFHQQRSALHSQVSKSREYNALMKKARLYISHFYQVLNFAIIRGDLPAVSRKFYGIRENDSRIPPLQTERDLLFWGEKLIKGEAERTANGGNSMTNPTAAVVKVRYEQFADASHSQKIMQKSTLYATDRIAALRAEADEIILSIWDEIEATFDLLPDDAKREKSASYGVVYVFRPYERGENQMVEEEMSDNVTCEEEIVFSNELNQLRLDELLVSESIEKQNQLQYAMAFAK
ncbi:MAG: hypothetical protein CVU05_05410 [Bacteroidetes bacterium HGW-Bacteroidetes-21]|nr:MAG: hypothetical protein CVU05_05410 [Bacteroidetes bacterium HGW-Bacteroidetes-21]